MSTPATSTTLSRQKSWSYHLHSLTVFILTFLSYSLFHANRKTFSNLKSTISAEWSMSFHNSTVPELKPDHRWNRHHFFNQFGDCKIFLGVLDTTFLISYAAGLYISGVVGDRLPLRYVLTFGMCGTGAVVFLFGVVTEWLQFYNTAFYVCIWIVNGLLQSTGWPTVVAVMGNWFGKSSRGLVLGIWSSCASVGNIIGALFTSRVLDFGYDYAFMVNSVVLFCGGIVVFCGLLESPREIGLPVADEITHEITIDEPVINVPEETESSKNDRQYIETLSNEQSIQQSADDKIKERPKAITFCQAVLLPGVILYSLAYANLKLVNYSLFFWLPYYLTGKFKWKETVADDISIWYDVGGIVGGAIIGFISDRFGKRAVVIIPFLIAAIPSLLFFSSTEDSLVSNAGMLALNGLFIGGVANLVSAAVSADLGRQGSIAGSEEALATVTGIVDGTGSAGAAAGQLIVPAVEDRYGWHVVFYIFISCTVLTGMCVMPLFIREVISLYRKRHTFFIFLHSKSERQSLLAEEQTNNEHE